MPPHIPPKDPIVTICFDVSFWKILCAFKKNITNTIPDKINDEFKKMLINKIPSGDLGTGDDVSNCVAFLASDMANYINGETIHVNGGMYMAWQS